MGSGDLPLFTPPWLTIDTISPAFTCKRLRLFVVDQLKSGEPIENSFFTEMVIQNTIKTSLVVLFSSLRPSLSSFLPSICINSLFRSPRIVLRNAWGSWLLLLSSYPILRKKPTVLQSIIDWITIQLHFYDLILLFLLFVFFFQGILLLLYCLINQEVSQID